MRQKFPNHEGDSVPIQATGRRVLNFGLAAPNLTPKAEHNPCLRDFGVTVQMHGCLAELTRRKPDASC